MTAPLGPDVPAAPQPPAGATPPPAQPEKKNNKKWLGLAGGVVVAGAIGAFALIGGPADAKAGDCIDMTSDTEFDVVDCGHCRKMRLDRGSRSPGIPDRG